MPNASNHYYYRKWSKRYRATIFFITLNFLTFWGAMFEGLDIMRVSSALLMLNSPLFAYIWAESVKPSKEIENNEIHS